MRFSKKEKALRAAAMEEERLWRENNPPPPPPPWTEAELKELDQMRSILDKLLYGQTHDIALVFEFLRLSRLFEGSSMRVWDLKRKAEHYTELQQYAAKEKLWQQMTGILYGLQTEVDSLRRRRDRGGTKAQ